MNFVELVLSGKTVGQIQSISYQSKISTCFQCDLLVQTSLTISEWRMLLPIFEIKINWNAQPYFIRGYVLHWQLDQFIKPSCWQYRLTIVPVLARLKTAIFAGLANNKSLRELINNACQSVHQPTQWLLLRELPVEKQWLRPLQNSWQWLSHLMAQAGLNAIFDHNSKQMPWLVSDCVEKAGGIKKPVIVQLVEVGSKQAELVNVNTYDWQTMPIVSTFNAGLKNGKSEICDLIAGSKKEAKRWAEFNLTSLNQQRFYQSIQVESPLFPGDRIEINGKLLCVENVEWQINCTLNAEPGLWLCRCNALCFDSSHPYRKRVQQNSVSGPIDHFFVKTNEAGFPLIANDGSYSLNAPVDWRDAQKSKLCDVRSRQNMASKDLDFNLPHPANSDILLGFGMQQTQFPIILAALHNQTQTTVTHRSTPQNASLRDQHGTQIALLNSGDWCGFSYQTNRRSMLQWQVSKNVTMNFGDVIDSQFRGMQWHINGNFKRHCAGDFLLAVAKNPIQYEQKIDAKSTEFQHTKQWKINDYQHCQQIGETGFKQILGQGKIQIHEYAKRKKEVISAAEYISIQQDMQKLWQGSSGRMRYQQLTKKQKAETLNFQQIGKLHRDQITHQHQLVYGAIQTHWTVHNQLIERYQKLVVKSVSASFKADQIKIKAQNQTESIGQNHIAAEHYQELATQHVHQGLVSVFTK